MGPMVPEGRNRRCLLSQTSQRRESCHINNFPEYLRPQSSWNGSNTRTSPSLHGGPPMASIDDITPGTWTIDESHTTVGFTARHLMITKVRGRFGKVEGAATIEEDRLQSSVQATIELGSIDTGDAGRDEHLRSGAFFDVANHPTITFASTSVKQDGSDFALSG